MLLISPGASKKASRASRRMPRPSAAAGRIMQSVCSSLMGRACEAYGCERAGRACRFRAVCASGMPWKVLRRLPHPLRLAGAARIGSKSRAAAVIIDCARHEIKINFYVWQSLLSGHCFSTRSCYAALLDESRSEHARRPRVRALARQGAPRPLFFSAGRD